MKTAMILPLCPTSFSSYRRPSPFLSNKHKQNNQMSCKVQTKPAKFDGFTLKKRQIGTGKVERQSTADFRLTDEYPEMTFIHFCLDRIILLSRRGCNS